jgi:hypothetical protein
MESSLRTALITGVAVSLLWTVPASAQRMSGRDVVNTPTANQIVDMADARFAALKANLRLTPEQDKNWNGFQSALHDIAVKRADEISKLRGGRTVANGETSGGPAAGNSQPNNPQGNAATGGSAQNQSSDATSDNAAAQNETPDEMQMLRAQADGLNRRADELKTIADAAQPLYASLDDRQRSQLMNFIRSNGGGEEQPIPQSRGRRR